jgi:hypothetical protein
MSRTHRIALLVPAVLALLNLIAFAALGSPCLPGAYPCIEG